ncbi:MAG: Sua5/YciO/YrdC/YwlC family protein [Candidatus Yanofskybacteria bacterium GW2011_GWA1_48_10]|uniref:L-threonylcarbamoyladenylate synthase n=2 Tax=Candidatus Yanofskyibacteriota TaxID=1752733 RepID=A0A0G1U6N0_9BACT|nr:MAG: Sua5/YciO/YrdC/YwlC family protein [Candidatus Yanofskybacteria bacterium GW2011_GWA1_48_10]OGN06131.1 MAG: threonylcarbamoyl-AMP synthase [Candidatus Yanofskybacteria bacterium RIFCSPHIGHO2_01_FULL_48_25b]
MKILQIDLNKDYTPAIREAVEILKMGGTIVYPTDTVYGLGCNALDEIAVRHIFDIKQRSSKPLPIIARDMRWVEELAHLNDEHRRLADKFWPGAFTLVFPKKEIVPPIVTTGLSGIGIRIPDFQFTDKLLGAFGYPLVSTSANVSNRPATGDINIVIETLGGQHRRPDLIIDAGVLPKSNSSVVIDCMTDKPKVLRVGPSKPDDLLKLLEI